MCKVAEVSDEQQIYKPKQQYSQKCNLESCVYCRLSKDDELIGESASISNQRDILVNYCQSQGWQVVDVFQDDGYTGLNTDDRTCRDFSKPVKKDW